MWLNVDQLAEKYPGINPYVFVANNPIMFIDDDGRDYRVFFNSATKTVTIKATYYALGKDMESAQKAIEYWNNQSGQFSYIVGKKENSVSYTVNFELSAIEVDVDPQLGERGSLNNALKQDSSGGANLYTVDNTGLDPNTNGTTIGGNYIKVKDTQADADTGSHEVGHSLGLKHNRKGLMTPASIDSSRSSNINSNDISDMIQYPAKGKVNSERNSEGNIMRAGRGTINNDTNFRMKDIKNGKAQ
ncbi:hypothetical protein [Myroides sp. WP-1]|uniref:hypothetical protein n=1 Tax=Myroides sp. WP-1 TaxID=2759944 RepID=UPI0015FA201D|nr:hypothetical protein [Myroides sp. WP-1]MBB1140693.1 hypothetical protein [Myroides sp. WP-1]